MSKKYFWTLCFFSFKNLLAKQSNSEIYAYSSYIFNLRIRYSWILYKIFVNRNTICQIKIFMNRNNIHEMELWPIGIGIYRWPKYQRIYLWIENYLLNTDTEYVTMLTIQQLMWKPLWYLWLHHLADHHFSHEVHDQEKL